jgi:endonuclease III
MERKKALKQLKFLSKGHKSMRLAAESWDEEWKILISTIMSARTLDETTIPTAEKLFGKYNSIKRLSKAKVSDVEKIIRPVNYYRNKSKNVVGCANGIVDNFNGKVPHEMEDLVSLPGVGAKTANVFLSEVGKDAIAVDTHVYYISRYLEWSKEKEPVKVGKDLEKLFPKNKWSSVNRTLVRFGKTHTSRKNKNKILDEVRGIS